MRPAPSLLSRIRWANLARVAALLLAVALIARGPDGCGRPTGNVLPPPPAFAPPNPEPVLAPPPAEPERRPARPARTQRRSGAGKRRVRRRVAPPPSVGRAPAVPPTPPAPTLAPPPRPPVSGEFTPDPGY